MYNDLEELKAMAGIASATPGMERSERPGGPLMSDRVPVKESGIPARSWVRTEVQAIADKLLKQTGATDFKNQMVVLSIIDNALMSVKDNLQDIAMGQDDDDDDDDDTFTTDDGREEPISGRMSDDEDTGVGGLIDMGR